MSEDVKRGPGRPKQDTLKKGNSSWKPASVTDVINKEAGYRYRWSEKSTDNLFKKQAEGWETVNGLQGDAVKPDQPNRIDGGAKMTSIYEKHDLILQRIPEDLALERDAYYNNETARRTSGLTAHVKKEIGKEGAQSHGDITISSRLGTQVID